jgi:hypothetical protein
LLALDRLGLGPAQAVAIEDTPRGVAAVKAAGLHRHPQSVRLDGTARRRGCRAVQRR